MPQTLLSHRIDDTELTLVEESPDTTVAQELSPTEVANASLQISAVTHYDHNETVFALTVCLDMTFLQIRNLRTQVETYKEQITELERFKEQHDISTNKNNTFGTGILDCFLLRTATTSR